MVGVTIGSGIFATPPRIAEQLGSPWLILLAWGLGGVLCLFGALTFTELAVVFPRSGGLYNFLYHGLGARVAFIFGWTYMLITKPFAAAGIAVVFAEHLNGPLGTQSAIAGLAGPGGSAMLERLLGPDWVNPLTVCAVLALSTWINSIGMRLGSGIGVVLTIAKFGALAAIVVLASVMSKGAAGSFASSPTGIPWYLAFAPVMAGVLWTYDGWSDVGSVAGEVRDPQRTLPRVYLVGTLSTIGLYLAVNAVYLWMIPLEEMRKSTNLAPIVMEKLLGPAGGMIVTAIVLVSTIGSTHASIITGARVTFAQSQDGLLFRFLSRVSPTQTPAIALWTQCGLSCLAVLFLRNFADLAGGFVFTMWIFYGLAAASVIILRYRRPDLPRTYRCPGFPFVPAVFTLAAVGMTLMTLISALNRDKPDWMPLVWLGVLVAGWPAYTLWRKWTGEGEGRAEGGR